MNLPTPQKPACLPAWLPRRRLREPFSLLSAKQLGLFPGGEARSQGLLSAFRLLRSGADVHSCGKTRRGSPCSHDLALLGGALGSTRRTGGGSCPTGNSGTQCLTGLVDPHLPDPSAPNLCSKNFWNEAGQASIALEREKLHWLKFSPRENFLVLFTKPRTAPLCYSRSMECRASASFSPAACFH